jgi:electron transfer flavoprotein beta subunit
VKIVVCVKHVPDIQSDRALRADGLLVRDDGEGTINELDENAVEAAVVLAEQVRDAGGEAEVVVVTVGPDDAEDAVRRGLQLGADAAVHVVDDAIVGSDVFGTAAVLAAVVRRAGDVDLVVTGMAGLDGLTSLLPAALADLLDLPQLTLAAQVTLADGVVTVRRDLDHATEVLRAPLPALVSVTDRANEPRYPAFAGIMAARKKKVEALAVDDLVEHGLDPAAIGTAGARTAGVVASPRPPRTDRVLVTDDGTAGAALAAYLVENGLVRRAPEEAR